MDAANKIAKAVDWIISECAREGIVVMRYDAISTHSVYLKFDDGVLGSLRISDHAGKKHLKYKYNLTMGSARKKRTHKGKVQCFAPFKDIEILFQQVLDDRDKLVDRYGAYLYTEFMKKNRIEADYSKGFWAHADYVQRELFINHEKNATI